MTTSTRRPPKAIVPAIPLPYVQKRKQQVAAREREREREQEKQELEKALELDREKKRIESESAEPVLRQTTPVYQSSSPGSPSASARTSPAGSTSITADIVSAQHTPLTENVLDASNDSVQDHTFQSSEPAQSKSSIAPVPVTTNGTRELDKKDIKGDVVERAPGKGNEYPSARLPIITPDLPAPAGKGSFHMPPAFVPANHSQPNTPNNTGPYLPPSLVNGQHPMHHVNPSAGSLHFGAYPDSNTSSPAPPVSSGHLPPFPHPQYAYGGGRHAANGQYTQNNFSPMGPPPGFRPQAMLPNHSSGHDNQIRRANPFAAEGFSPSPTPPGFENYQTTYDSPAMHSLHGSQSSAPHDRETAAHAPYHNSTISSASNGHFDETRAHFNRQTHNPGPNSHTLPPTRVPYAIENPVSIDHYDGLVHYVQSQFANPEFADWELELRYADDRASPIRVLGHNLIFARSPRLKDLMSEQLRTDRNKTIVLESKDRFLNNDGFWLALRRLYGGNLMDTNSSLQHVPQGYDEVSKQYSVMERFHTALSYSAAGHMLNMPPVVARGVEVATYFLAWNTVEKALDFVLDGGVIPRWADRGKPVPGPTYGPPVEMMLRGVLEFITRNFPADFELDENAVSPDHSPRFPVVLQAPIQKVRLRSLKFGDLPSEQGNMNESAGPLSRILINVPFPYLKLILESDGLRTDGQWWEKHAPLRGSIMRAVITEREKRRSIALQLAKSNEVIDSHVYATLHHREEIIPSDDGPKLNRVPEDNYIGS